jgi:hypothetical protein
MNRKVERAKSAGVPFHGPAEGRSEGGVGAAGSKGWRECHFRPAPPPLLPPAWPPGLLTRNQFAPFSLRSRAPRRRLLALFCARFACNAALCAIFASLTSLLGCRRGRRACRAPQIPGPLGYGEFPAAARSLGPPHLGAASCTLSSSSAVQRTIYSCLCCTPHRVLPTAPCALRANCPCTLVTRHGMFLAPTSCADGH